MVHLAAKQLLQGASELAHRIRIPLRGNLKYFGRCLPLSKATDREVNDTVMCRNTLSEQILSVHDRVDLTTMCRGRFNSFSNKLHIYGFVFSFVAKCELWPFCNGFDSLFCTDRHIFFLTFGHIATGRVNNDWGGCRAKPQEQQGGLALFADLEVVLVCPPPDVSRKNCEGPFYARKPAGPCVSTGGPQYGLFISESVTSSQVLVHNHDSLHSLCICIG